MKKIVYLLTVLALAGCNTPSMAFRGIGPTKVSVDGSTFDVWVKGLLAQAIRTNVQYAPRMGPIGKRAKAAIEQASGCEVYRVGGDQALISAVLDCGKGPPQPLPIVNDYECHSVGRIDIGNGDLRDLTLECIAVKRQ